MLKEIALFIKSVWGYVLVGGITIGMLVSMIVLWVKTLGAIKKKDNQTERALQSKISEKIASESNSLYFDKVVSVMFEAIIYIIMASKMTQGDKITLQSLINSVDKDSYIEIVKKVLEQNNIEDIETKIEEIVENAPEVIQETIQVATTSKTLLDKYSKQ